MELAKQQLLAKMTDIEKADAEKFYIEEVEHAH